MFCEFCPADGSGGCAVCGFDQDAAEELRRLDGSLGLDALERVEGRIAGVTCEGAGV